MANIKKAFNLVKWLTALAALALSVALCYACISIYLSGDNSPYTVESVESGLKTALYPGVAFALFAVMGIALNSIFGKEKPKYGLNAYSRLMLSKRYALALPPDAQKYENARAHIIVLALAVCVMLLAYPIAFLMDKRNFSSFDLEKMISSAALKTLPFVGAAMIVVIVTSLILAVLMNKEADILLSSPKGNFNKREPVKPSKYMLLFLLMVSIFLIVHGIFNEGLNDVFKKAVAICTECIGLG